MITANTARSLMPDSIKKTKEIAAILDDIEKKIIAAAQENKTRITIDVPQYDIEVKNKLEELDYLVYFNCSYFSKLMIIIW